MVRFKLPYEGCRVHLKSSTRSNPYGSKSNSPGATGRLSSCEGVSEGEGVFGIEAMEGTRQKAERNISNGLFLLSFSNEAVALGLGAGGGVGAANPELALSLSGSSSTPFSLASRSLSFALARSLTKTNSFLNLFTLASSHFVTLNGSKKLPDEKSHQHLSINFITILLTWLPLSVSFNR